MAADPGLDHVGLFYDGDAGPVPLATFTDDRGPSDPLVLVGTERRLAPTVEAMKRSATRPTIVTPTPDADAMVHRVVDPIQALVSAGAGHVRVLGLPDWGGEEWPPPEDLLWLEARLTPLIALLPTTVVCGWDVARLPAQALFYLEELHSIIWRDGVIAENPHAIDPERWTVERGATLPWLDGRRARRRPSG